MNLWVRTFGQLAALAVALFFFSCEDESSILGFKNPNSKFKVNYVDIPLPSDVFVLDSLRTSNDYSLQSGETFRLLAGKYSDQEFGNVTATAFSQFFTTNFSKSLLKESAVFDSVSIRLQFDFYVYGSEAATPQTISVHELQKALDSDSIRSYFNKSTTPYDPTPLGTKTFTIVPDDFKDYIADRTDTTITVTIPLDPSFGQRIFQSALRYRDAATVDDSTFVKYSKFVEEFKGIAIVPDAGDKVLGFNPSGACLIQLHYHDIEADSLTLNLAFSGTVGYSAITADRSASELAGLTAFSQPFQPDGTKRYIQAGTGVLTRLDFQPFYDFVDADTNTTVIINSAELMLGPTVSSTPYDTVSNLFLIAVKNGGHVKRVADKKTNPAQNAADSASVAAYAGKMGITDSYFSPLDGNGNILTISKPEREEYYNGFLTLFTQEFFRGNKLQKDRFRYFALYPANPPAGKSLNRAVFDADNIKLRIYYTRPTELSQ